MLETGNLVVYYFSSQAPKPEDIIADIVFLVDSSNSVTSLNFQLEKKFVKAMARSLNVSPDKSRASVIVYGSKHNVMLSLDEATDLDGLKRAVDTASYVNGPRRMDLALEAASAVMNQATRNVPKIVILLTAGKQSPTNTPFPLSSAVKPLRDLGAQTYVVAISGEPDKQELVTVVDDSKDIFEVPQFEALLPQATQIAKSIAGRSGKVSGIDSFHLHPVYKPRQKCWCDYQIPPSPSPLPVSILSSQTYCTNNPYPRKVRH